MQTRLSSSFFPLPSLALSLFFFRKFVALSLLARALSCFFFLFSLPLVRLSRARTQTRCAERETNSKSTGDGARIGRSLTTWVTPPIPASARHWLLFARRFSQPSTRSVACMRARERVSVHACSLTRFFSRLSSSFLSCSLAPIAHTPRTCVCTDTLCACVLARASTLGLQKSTGCFWKTARSLKDFTKVFRTQNRYLKKACGKRHRYF